MLTPPLQVCLVAGSAERPSRILASMEFLASLLQRSGVVASIWDLAGDPLPLFDPRFYPDPYANESEVVRRFAQQVDQADALVWGTPVYHNTFSGILKNALDSLSIAQFRHKPIALTSCGNNDRTGGQPCDHLRAVARGLLAVAIPTQMITLPSDYSFAQGHYHLTNETLFERTMRLVEELVTYATLLRPLRVQNVDYVLTSKENGFQPVNTFSRC